MRAQELRVGNYVDTPVGVKRVVSIVSSADGSIYDIRTATRAIPGEENLFIDCELSPIPLTEELLLKIGFWGSGVCEFEGVQRHFLSMAVTTKLMIVIEIRKLHLCMIEQSRIVLLSTVEHLHQLQNLYFALTGEELEVKLDRLHISR